MTNPRCGFFCFLLVVAVFYGVWHDLVGMGNTLALMFALATFVGFVGLLHWIDFRQQVAAIREGTRNEY